MSFYPWLVVAMERWFPAVERGRDRGDGGDKVVVEMGDGEVVPGSGERERQGGWWR